MARKASQAYREAGVDLRAATTLVDGLRDLSHPGLLPGAVGGFAATAALPAGYRKPVLAMACDGVGTKLALLARAGMLGVAGHDLVAMCANDVACVGARPWMMLDYYACGRLDPAQARQVVDGMLDACAKVGCQLAGGETAELPGALAPGGLELAGFMLGVAEGDGVLGPSAARPGDTVLGVRAMGLHCNGFALVARVLEERGLDLGDRVVSGRGEVGLAELLLAPTPLYPCVVRALLGEGLPLRSAAHITGGGLAANLARAVAAGLAVRVDRGALVETAAQAWLREAGGLDAADMDLVFNGGVGMGLVLAPAAAADAMALLAELGHEAVVLGEVVTGGG